MEGIIEKDGQLYYDLQFWENDIKSQLGGKFLDYNKASDTWSITLAEISPVKYVVNYVQFYNTIIEILKKFIYDNILDFISPRLDNYIYFYLFESNFEKLTYFDFVISKNKLDTYLKPFAIKQIIKGERSLVWRNYWS